MTTAGPPDSSLVTTIPTHDRGASAGLSRRESPLHPSETPMVSETMVTETWRPRDSGRETLPRNSSSSPTRKPSPVSRARRRFRQDRPSPFRQSSPALRTSRTQGTLSRQPSPALRTSPRHCHTRQGTSLRGSLTTARGQRYRPDSVDRSSPSCQDDDDRRTSSGSPPTPESSRRRRDAGRGTTQRRPPSTSRDRRHREDPATRSSKRRRVSGSPRPPHASPPQSSRHLRTPRPVRRHIVVPTTVGAHANRRRRPRGLCVAAATPAATPRGASRHRLHAADITVVTAIIRPDPSRRQRHDVSVVATMLVATLLLPFSL